MKNKHKELDERQCIKTEHFVYATERVYRIMRFQCIENESIIELALLCNT